MCSCFEKKIIILVVNDMTRIKWYAITRTQTETIELIQQAKERYLLPMRASIPSRSKGMQNRILLQANVQGVVLCAMIQRQTANGKRFLHNIPFFLGRKFSSHYSHLYQVMQSKTFTKTITSCDVCNRKCIMLDSIDFAMSIPTLNIKMQLATLL